MPKRATGIWRVRGSLVSGDHRNRRPNRYPGRRRRGSRSRPPPRPAPSCGEALSARLCPMSTQKVVGNAALVRRLRVRLGAGDHRAAIVTARRRRGAEKPRDRRGPRSPTATSGASRWRATRGATTATREWRLRDPDAIVLHYTAGGSYCLRLEHFRLQRAEPRRAARASAPTTWSSRAATIAELVPPRIRCRHAIGLNHRSIGIEMVQEAGAGSALGRPRRSSSAGPRSAPPCASSRWLQDRYGIADRRRDRPLDGQRQPLLQGPPGLAQRPHATGSSAT